MAASSPPDVNSFANDDELDRLNVVEGKKKPIPHFEFGSARTPSAHRSNQSFTKEREEEYRGKLMPLISIIKIPIKWEAISRKGVARIFQEREKSPLFSFYTRDRRKKDRNLS